MRSQEQDDRKVLGVLDREECMVLLRWEVVGRLAVAPAGEAPTVVPVNFEVDRDTIVLRVGEGELWARLPDQLVALQVDRFDWFRRIGWSVLAQGRAEEIPVSVADELGIEPWAPGARPHAIRITPTSITGRRIELRQSPLDGRGYL